jgi:hypothetical protein
MLLHRRLLQRLLHLYREFYMSPVNKVFQGLIQIFLFFIVGKRRLRRTLRDHSSYSWLTNQFSNFLNVLIAGILQSQKYCNLFVGFIPLTISPIYCSYILDEQQLSILFY